MSSFGMQSQEYADRVIDLGVDTAKVTVTGNLKHADGDGHDRSSAEEPMADLNGGTPRRILVAGSTHRGEEEVLLEAFSNLKSHLDTHSVLMRLKNYCRERI